jgi:nucleolin
MADSDSRKLFVAGLSDAATEGGLRKLFESVGGSVIDIAVPRDRQTGAARGFGFVTFSTDAEAAAARDQLDGSFHEGRSISVRPFRGNRPESPGGAGPGSMPPRSSGPISRAPRPMGGGEERGPAPGGGGGEDRENTLFIANLPQDCTQQSLMEVFAAAGVAPVVKLHLPLDAEGRRRGFGFVTLRDAAAARSAVAALQGTLIGGRAISVDVARPRGDRPERPPPPGGGDRPGGWRPVSSRPTGAPRDGVAMGGGSPAPAPGYSDSSGSPPTERQTWDERRAGDRRKKEGAAPAKRKKAAGPADRGKARRENEGFRAPRSRSIMDDRDDE